MRGSRPKRGRRMSRRGTIRRKRRPRRGGMEM